MAGGRQRMAQRADDQAAHQAGIAEAHLGLGRMDVHVDLAPPAQSRNSATMGWRSRARKS